MWDDVLCLRWGVTAESRPVVLIWGEGDFASECLIWQCLKRGEQRSGSDPGVEWVEARDAAQYPSSSPKMND